MRFDITDLRLFVAIVEAGSITHGAQRANMALPSASARVSGMEAVLGVPLLERGRRGTRPTPAGRSLLHHARTILRQVGAMQEELGQFTRGLRGHVRLMTHTAALTEILPDRLADFLTAHPGIDIHVEERESRHIIGALLGNRTDVGVLTEAALTETGSPALDAIPFQEDRLVAIMPAGHRLAGQDALTFADILEEDFVGLREGSALQEHIDRHAAMLGRSLKIRVRLTGFEGVCRVVGRGAGLGIMPVSSARRHRAATGIVIAPLTDPWALRRVVICTRRNETLPPPAQQLVNHLIDRDASHPSMA